MNVGDDYFEQLFASSDDPWSFRTRWYERRKRELILASLPRQHYQRVFEPACANGELSAALAPRTTALLCQDLDARAVALAQQRLAGFAQVRVQRGSLPGDWPGGHFELIVLGEIGYYLNADQWHEVIDRAVLSLGGSGDLLACHWLHPIAGAPLNGLEVHAMLQRLLPLHRVLRHEEPDFLLEYWSYQPQAIDLQETCA